MLPGLRVPFLFGNEKPGGFFDQFEDFINNERDSCARAIQFVRDLSERFLPVGEMWIVSKVTLAVQIVSNELHYNTT